MDKMILEQPTEKSKDGFWNQVVQIAKANGKNLLNGTGMTLYISLIGTVAGLAIGLLIGVFRTIPRSHSKLMNFFLKFIDILLSIYIEVFRGTPMIVQAMVIYYGSAMAFHINIDRTVAALFIVSVNTGAYMSEIVRGGIYAVDKGQFEAAQAIGMTHTQTMRKVVLPQVLRNILPATGNEFVINIKDTSVLNVIAVSELYFQGNTAAMQNFMYFQTFTIIAVIYFILTFTVTRILRLIENKIDGPKNVIPYANQMQVERLEHDLGEE
jgi:putative lysine transport system permease protein